MACRFLLVFCLLMLWHIRKPQDLKDLLDILVQDAPALTACRAEVRRLPALIPNKYLWIRIDPSPDC